MTTAEIISKNISTLRKKNKMTQSELADKLNYTEQAISKWERGLSLPDAVVLYEISKIFNVEISYLYTIHEDIIFTSKEESELNNKEKRIKITFIISIAFIISALLFSGVVMAVKDKGINKLRYATLCMPIVSFCFLVINYLYGKKKYLLAITSSFIWTTVIALLTFFDNSTIMIFTILIAIVLQIAIILFPQITKHFNELRNKTKEVDKVDTK